MSLFALMMVGLCGYVILKDQPPKETKTTVATRQESVEKWQEGVVSYNGKYYKYNNQIKSYLFLGIDQDGTVEEASKGGKGGQSDVLFVMVQDKKNKSLSTIAINRNTMTLIDTYDIAGKYVDTQLGHICLQHSYGDGGRQSCSFTASAVSRLLNNIPISGFYSLNMDGIPILNDAVGGIELTVLEDLKNESRKVELKQGETKTLTGDEAYVYIRQRDINKFNSASDRLERHKQYIEALIAKLRAIADSKLSDVADVYSKVDGYAVTNIQLADLMVELKDYQYNGKMYSLPGQMKQGKEYEEYIVDDEDLYELVLKIFYEEVEAPNK